MELFKPEICRFAVVWMLAGDTVNESITYSSAGCGECRLHIHAVASLLVHRRYTHIATVPLVCTNVTISPDPQKSHCLAV